MLATSSVRARYCFKNLVLRAHPPKITLEDNRVVNIQVIDIR